MSDAKKQQLKASKKAAVLTAAQSLLTSPVPSPFGLPRGVRIETNSGAVARFPLPLTIGSAIMFAVGAIARMRGYTIIGTGIMALSAAGVAAAAAAPELNAAIKKAL